MKLKPTLSIITVCLNNNEGLERTIKSIKQQSFNDYEHIIIDAGSTDGSRQTILQYSQEINSKLVFWTSEPDKGIYDGMNKGIKQASGEYLYFLNSGDSLKEDILKKIEFDGTQYIYGDITIIYDDGRAEDKISAYPLEFMTILFDISLCHQACFIHYSLFQNCIYNTEYKITADWVHIMDNIILKECSYKHISLLIANYDTRGFSSTEEGWLLIMEERLQWLKKNIPSPYIALVMQLKKTKEELNTYKNSEIGKLIPLLNQTRRFQKWVKKLVLFLYQINSLFSCKR